MYDTSNCPYFSESCPVCDDGECGCFECLERIEKQERIQELNARKEE